LDVLGAKLGSEGRGRVVRVRSQTLCVEPKNPLDIAGEVNCPVLALYGGADPNIPLETINKRLAAGKTCEGIVFADTPHGFNADYRPSYRAAQAKDGWARMLAWFKQNGLA
jgi:carboxymethylenebutenolidase